MSVHVLPCWLQMEKKRQKEVEMQRLEQIREEFKKKTEGLLQFRSQWEKSVTIATLDAGGCHGNITVRGCLLQCLKRSQKVVVQKQLQLVTFTVRVRVMVRV